MPQSVMRTIMVTGDNHRELSHKFSMDKKVSEYVKYRYSDAHQIKQNHLKLLKGIMDSDILKLTERQRDYYKDLYLDIESTDDFDYYVQYANGCRFDEENFDAYSTENPFAHYKYEKCYQERLEKTGEEASFSNPFILLDGTKAYVAKKGDIDWDRMHLYNTQLYERVWELCVDNDKPISDNEKTIKENMKNRNDYFANFKDKEEYAMHSCSFWCYGVIDINGDYHEVDYTVSDKEWVRGFYDKYVESLPDDTTLSIYEVRSLDN